MGADIQQLIRKANRIRQLIIQCSYNCGRAAHPGAALSCADIVAALYYHFMNINPEWPDMPGRDRFIMSKGHGCQAQYAALADLGFFPVDELDKLRHSEALFKVIRLLAKPPALI